eukprot:UN24313
MKKPFKSEKSFEKSYVGETGLFDTRFSWKTMKEIGPKNSLTKKHKKHHETPKYLAEYKQKYIDQRFTETSEGYYNTTSPITINGKRKSYCCRCGCDCCYTCYQNIERGFLLSIFTFGLCQFCTGTIEVT